MTVQKSLLRGSGYAATPSSYRHDFTKLAIRKIVSDLIGKPVQNRYVKTCPLCGHHDCFRFVPNTEYFICFSSDCLKQGHVLQFVAFYKKISIRDAADYLITTYFKQQSKTPIEGEKRMTSQSTENTKPEVPYGPF